MMRVLTFASGAALGLLLFFACSSPAAVGGGGAEAAGDYRAVITAGDSWLHDFKLFLWFAAENPPQYALWLEDEDGSYLGEIAVTEKIATEGWVMNGGNRRVEALPYWAHRRGRVYSDGLMLPTGNDPLPDAVTTASAETDSAPGFQLETGAAVRLVAEFNHSTDFNSNYPKGAEPGTSGYSGGGYGSGQPSVVYSAVVSREVLEEGPVRLELVGHGSPDGSDGKLYPDCTSLTTALSIVNSVTVEKK